MVSENRLHANGKLLISGEYLVIAGSKALAFPLKFGQSIHINPSENRLLTWTSDDPQGTWFTCEMDPVTIESLQTSNPGVSEYLRSLLKAARQLNPLFLTDPEGLNITVNANYPLKWGLGSSSTLIALIAGWAQVDKFKLFRLISKGSGYDVACTDRHSMFFYQLNHGTVYMNDTQPGNGLLKHTCFAYLGNKQESAREVSDFLSKGNFSQTDINRISDLSMLICNADDPSILCYLVEEHEEILSRILNKERIAKRFPGFPGSVKSLGAWGGDFAMFTSELDHLQIKKWLQSAGLVDIFTFDELKVTTH
jgi:mevalonate kinase